MNATRNAIALGAMFAATAAAQLVSSSLQGQVQDPSGAPVAAAKAELRRGSTGFARETATSDEGRFFFFGLEPGAYTLTVSKPGFRTEALEDIPLATGERLDLGALKLTIGAVSESVVVSARAEVLQTAGGERAEIITGSQIENLATLDRDPTSLIGLSPGVVDSTNKDSVGGRLDLNVLGGRGRSNNISIDGAVSMTADAGNNPLVAVSQDSVAEVRIMLSNYQAEYGRMSGANVEIATKSGTREFHGMAGYFKRHEQFNAAGFFDNRESRAKTRYRYNTWSYNVGGPIYIPGKFNRGRDRLFFFWSQEFWPLVSGTSARLTMPTEAERRGDFSQSVDVNNRLIAVNDPFTANRSPFPGNVIPASRLDPNGQALIRFLALPNFNNRAVSLGQYNYIGISDNENDKNLRSLKVNYNASNRHTLAGSFNRIFSMTKGYFGLGFTTANWPQMQTGNGGPNEAASLRHTFVATPRLITEVQFGYMRNIGQDPTPESEFQKNQRANAGFRAGQFDAKANPLDLLPAATFGGITNPPAMRFFDRFPWSATQSILNLDGRVTWVRGGHTLKAGGYHEQFHRDMPIQGATPWGAFDFGRNVNNPLDTNHPFGNAMLGVFSTYSETSGRPDLRARSNVYEFFAQDNWKVRPGLTLDAGLRFCWYPPMHEGENRMSALSFERYDRSRAPRLIQPAFDSARRRIGLDPATGQAYSATLIGTLVPGSGDPFNGMVAGNRDSGYPSAMVESAGVQWGPRIGFAWDATGQSKTVVRGGFGIFYNREVLQSTYRFLTGQAPDTVTPFVQFAQISDIAKAPKFLSPLDVYTRNRQSHVPNVMNYSLGVQRTLDRGTALDVSYVAALGRHLIWQRDLSSIPLGTNFLASSADPTTPGRPLAPAFLRPIAGYNSVRAIEEASSSNYHSLQVALRRRFASSLRFGLSWTWSKAMDFNDDDIEVMTTLVSPRVWSYGMAAFDRTHVFKLNYQYQVPRIPIGGAGLRFLTAGWQLSGVTTFQSGAPMGVTLQTTNSADITGTTSLAARTVVVGDAVLPASERTFNRAFDTGVFRLPATGTFGNAAKTLFRGPGIANWDAALMKEFRVRERFRAQFRWEMYNAFNHTQFSNVNATARFDPTGTQVNAGFGQYSAARRPRYMQLGLRLTF